MKILIACEYSGVVREAFFEGVPIDYEGLKAWLPAQKSKYGNDCGIEGIVWHCENGDMYKIKVKDFSGGR